MNEDTQRITSLVFYGAVVLIAVLAFRIVEPFLMQIGWAVVLAICVAPLQARLSRRFGPLRSALFLTLMVILLLVVPLLLVVRTLLHEGANAVQYVQTHVADRGGPLGLFQAAWQWLRQRLPFLPEEQAIVQQISQRLGGLAGTAASRAGQVVKEVLEFLFNLVITLSIFFFVVKDGPQMARLVRRLLPFGAAQNAHLLALVRDIVATSVTSTLVIAIVQGIVGGIAFFAVGIPGALLWACLMSVMALLPVVGSTLIWAPAALWLALSGSLVKGIVIAAVGVLILGNVDNVVRPLMLSGTARLSTLTLIISLLGGVSAFGFIGVVLGPVVAAVLTAFVKTYALAPEEEPVTLAPPPAAAVPPPPAAPA